MPPEIIIGQESNKESVIVTVPSIHAGTIGIEHMVDGWQINFLEPYPHADMINLVQRLWERVGGSLSEEENQHYRRARRNLNYNTQPFSIRFTYQELIGVQTTHQKDRDLHSLRFASIETVKNTLMAIVNTVNASAVPSRS